MGVDLGNEELWLEVSSLSFSKERRAEVAKQIKVVHQTSISTKLNIKQANDNH